MLFILQNIFSLRSFVNDNQTNTGWKKLHNESFTVYQVKYISKQVTKKICMEKFGFSVFFYVTSDFLIDYKWKISTGSSGTSGTEQLGIRVSQGTNTTLQSRQRSMTDKTNLWAKEQALTILIYRYILKTKVTEKVKKKKRRKKWKIKKKSSNHENLSLKI